MPQPDGLIRKINNEINLCSSLRKSEQFGEYKRHLKRLEQITREAVKSGKLSEFGRAIYIDTARHI